MRIPGSRASLPFLLLAIGGLIWSSGCSRDQKTATSSSQGSASQQTTASPPAEPAPGGPPVIGLNVGDLAPRLKARTWTARCFG